MREKSEKKRKYENTPSAWTTSSIVRAHATAVAASRRRRSGVLRSDIKNEAKSS